MTTVFATLLLVLLVLVAAVVFMAVVFYRRSQGGPVKPDDGPVERGKATAPDAT